MAKLISRRDFLKGSAAGAAAVAAAGMLSGFGVTALAADRQRRRSWRPGTATAMTTPPGSALSPSPT